MTLCAAAIFRLATAPTVVADPVAGRPEALKGFLTKPHEPMPPLELSIRQIDVLAAFILAPPPPAR